MQKNDSPMYLPTLDQVIDRNPLRVTPDTPLANIITMMGQIRTSCPLGDHFLPEPLPSQPANIGSSVVSPLVTESRSGCVFIIDDRTTESSPRSRLKGIFTERDLVQLIASGQNLKDLAIAEVMSQPVITLLESEVEDIFTALLILRQHRIRHLPILDRFGLLVGVVTPESIRKAMLQPANILKMRSVEEVMTLEVIHASPTASVLSLAQLMARHRVSCIVICEERRQPMSEPASPTDSEVFARSSERVLRFPLGLVTERDIVQFQALELDLSQVEAQTVMSTPLFCLRPEHSLWVAHQEMQQRYVRRLVVAGQQGELLGLITQTSLLRVLDPMEMSGVIDALHMAVEQRTSELKKAIAQLESEIVTRERTEHRLRLLESAVVNATDAIVIMDAGPADRSDPRIVYVNEAFTRMSGYSPEEIIGKTPSCLRGPDTNPAQIAKIRAAFTHCEPLRIELVNYRKDGSTYWVELNSVPVTDRQGNLTHWVSVQRDVTDRKRMEQALFEEKELAQVTLQSIGDGVITTDANGCISSLNRVAEKLTGWSLAEAKGLPLTDVFRIVSELTGFPEENTAQIALREGRIVDLANHCVLVARNGREFAIDHSAAPIHASDGQIVGAVVVFRDVTQIRTQARQLSWQATHDALTGLVNRREFEYRLERAVESAQTCEQQHILLYLDLDRFKIVNDTCGHIAGDELLRQVTEHFKNRIRKTDTLARLGGDEFAVLLYQCPQERGVQVADSLLQGVQSFRFVWQDKTFSIGVSIGLVCIDTAIASPSSILTAADAACYVAKNKGRNRLQIYQASDRELARQQGETQWAMRINQALEDNWFRLYYQPIVCLSNPKSNSEHYEVLLRLQDETGQVVSPMAFIPAAERYNLMHAIDRWVIRTLFSQLKETRSIYAINLSGASINDDQFIDFLHEQFTKYQISPQNICFEITETLAIANLSKAAGLIRKLKELGCCFALDDFGSGMSSFAYLKNLPVDFVKIDGNFVKNIVDNPIDLAMVEAINRIGHVMGIQTIAEYVENESVLEKLRELEVDYAQGYFLGRPQPFHLAAYPCLGDGFGEFNPKTLSFEEKIAS